jgi:hypothetical protein
VCFTEIKVMAGDLPAREPSHKEIINFNDLGSDAPHYRGKAGGHQMALEIAIGRNAPEICLQRCRACCNRNRPG